MTLFRPVLAAALAALCVTSADAEAVLDPKAIAACWKLNSLKESAQAAAITVTLELDPEAKPIPNSIRLIAPKQPNGPERRAFMAGREAIIACGAKGFDLPAGQYDKWKNLRVTFDAKDMVTR